MNGILWPYAAVSQPVCCHLRSRRAATDLDQTTAQETLPAEGYDVLDSLRADPGLAPVLAHLQAMDVDLEPDADPDADELVS